jgi:hypothetical protein
MPRRNRNAAPIIGGRKRRQPRRNPHHTTETQHAREVAQAPGVFESWEAFRLLLDGRQTLRVES